MAEGKVIKEIAAVLNLPPRAVEFHKNNIVAKNGLRTTAELARYAPVTAWFPNQAEIAPKPRGFARVHPTSSVFRLVKRAWRGD